MFYWQIKGFGGQLCRSERLVTLVEIQHRLVESQTPIAKSLSSLALRLCRLETRRHSLTTGLCHRIELGLIRLTRCNPLIARGCPRLKPERWF